MLIHGEEVGPGMQLFQENLYGADLHGVDLSGSWVYMPNLQMADLSAANLSDVFSRGAHTRVAFQ